MPQKALPRTVIRRIFQAYHTPCHNHPHQRCRIRSCITSSALLLGKVCKEWRIIAWDIPDLWTWIEIKESSKNPDVRLQLAREWLERSSGQPLTVIVHIIPYISQFGTPLSRKLFEVIGKYSMQWRVLDVNVVTGDSVAVGRPRGEKEPILRQLGMSGIKSTAHNILPWLRLTSLTLNIGLGVSTNSNFSTIMDNSPNLEMLRVDTLIVRMNDVVQEERESVSEQTSPTALPQHLKSLVVRSNLPSVFLKNVRASSSLSSLSIIIQGGEDLIQVVATSVTDFINRSQCSLRAFGLSTMLTIDMESLSFLFAKLTSTKFLYIHTKNTRNYKQIANEIPQLLNPSSRVSRADDILLPNLQVLYYHFFDLGIVPRKLLDMIKCRCYGRDVGKEDIVADGQFARLRVVRFNKTNPRTVADLLLPEIHGGLEMTYDLPYKGEPFE